jgi:hypothetical protein
MDKKFIEELTGKQLPPKVKTVKELVKLAASENKFKFNKAVNGKLNQVRPWVGDIVVFEDYDYAVVTRQPNSVGDYLIRMKNNKTAKCNICNDGVEGFVTL